MLYSAAQPQKMTTGRVPMGRLDNGERVMVSPSFRNHGTSSVEPKKAERLQIELLFFLFTLCSKKERRNGRKFD